MKTILFLLCAACLCSCDDKEKMARESASVAANEAYSTTLRDQKERAELAGTGKAAAAKERARRIKQATAYAEGVRSRTDPLISMIKEQIAELPAGGKLELAKMDLAKYEKAIAEAEEDVRKAERD